MVKRNFSKLLVSLLPKGTFWDSLSAAPRFKILAEAIGLALKKHDERIYTFMDAMLIQGENYDLLADWEKFVGKLSPFVEAPTDDLAERKKLMITKLRAFGSPDQEYYLSMIRSLGFEDVEIIEHKPMRAGMHIGKPLRASIDWYYTVIFKLNPGASKYITGDIDRNLKTAINYYKPAHLVFSFRK